MGCSGDPAVTPVKQAADPNTTGPALTVVDHGTAPDDITVVIPSNHVPGKFARVRIAIPPEP